jgi:palmitoyltransferase
MNDKWKNFCYQLANYSGVMYTSLIVGGLTYLCLFHICPTIYGEGQCSNQFVYAGILLFEIIINLFCFHYYNKRNQIAYWTVKSSSLLFEESETLAQLGRKLTDDEVLARHAPNQKMLMDSRSSESLQNAPPPFARLNYRDPVLGYPFQHQYQEPEEEQQPLIVDPPDTRTTKYCTACNIIVPRRCHHCPLCKICILRKDHHCFLTGGCVGLANQRYFIIFLFWAIFGAFYGTFLTSLYLNEYVAPFYPFGWFQHVGPVALVRWAFGYESLFNMFIAVMFSMSFSSGFGALAFFGFQMFYTLEGYTMHDYHVSRINDHLESDGENYTERLALVFGRRWWLNFIFPQFWVPNQLTHSIARNIFLSVSKDL